MKKILENKFVQIAIMGGMAILLLLLVLPPKFSLAHRLSNFTVHFMLLFLGAALLAFAFDLKKLMLASFFCCGVLCLVLKGSSNQNMRLAKETTLPKISIGVVNMSLAEDGYFQTISKLKKVDPDVFVFQELTPEWRTFLIDSLIDSFPYVHQMFRLDPYGMGIFSKYPLSKIDTFLSDQIPNIYAHINWEDDFPLHVISAYSLPPVNTSAYEQIQSHFGTIHHYIDTLDGPIMVLGDYNLPPWADVVEGLKYNSDLRDSRRDMTQRAHDGSVSFFGTAFDHIFFNKKLQCIAFNELSNQSTSHLGILGTYQLKSDQPNIDESSIQ